MKSKARSRCSNDLLLFRTSKLAQNSLCDGGRRLNRQGVHEHGRGGRHLGSRGAVLAAASEEGWLLGSSSKQLVVNKKSSTVHAARRQDAQVDETLGMGILVLMSRLLQRGCPEKLRSTRPVL